MDEGEDDELAVMDPSHMLLDKSPATTRSNIARNKYIFVATITFVYCLAEVALALYTGSLSLLSDAFHNIGDMWALFIAFYCETAKTRRPTARHSYGWQRLEVLGGLANGWSLIALAIYITLQAIPRFISPEPIEEGRVFVVIAAAGLLVNVIGTFLFSGHGHLHSHSHGHGHGHTPAPPRDKPRKTIHVTSKKGHSHSAEHEHDDDHAHSHGHGGGHEHSLSSFASHSHSHAHGHPHAAAHHDSHEDCQDDKEDVDVNMRAVFLHFLGDCISSFCVLLTGLFIENGTGKWVLYVDPVSSLIIVVVILITTIPLVRHCSSVVLQMTPSYVDVHALQEDLNGLQGVVVAHELHVWGLSSRVVVGSVHLVLQDVLPPGFDRDTLTEAARRIFHKHGVHSVTVQIETLLKTSTKARKRVDAMICSQHCSAGCTRQWCCALSQAAPEDAHDNV